METSISVKAFNMATKQWELVAFKRMTPVYLIDETGRRWFRSTGLAVARPQAANMQLPGASVTEVENHLHCAEAAQTRHATLAKRGRKSRARAPHQLALAL